MNFHQYIEKMPKVELHVHLDGAFVLDFLFDLVQKYGGDPEIKSITDLQNWFVFRDFPHFIETWFWKNRFFREPVDFEESAYQTLQEFSRQNIVYLEAIFSPWDYKESGVNPTDIARANQNAVKRAQSDFNIHCRLMVDITRDHGHEHAMDRLDEITPFLGEEIIGIGLGGSEQRFPAHLFKDVFIEAKRRGFHCVAHAGEVVGPESVWSAIKDLETERIGHGVRAVEDPELVEYLRIEQIPLEVCIVSNIKTGVYSSFNEHPFAELFHKGLLVTVNSDDPTMFGSSLADEYSVLYQNMNLTLPEIRHVQINAVESSFAPMDEKRKIKDLINRFWIDNALSITND
ncbi:adenosine deaminase [bacterium]|nr:adenosine deaminase [bacterium]MBU1874699.1 adenosine deaminase [bacterium]